MSIIHEIVISLKGIERCAKPTVFIETFHFKLNLKFNLKLNLQDARITDNR